MGFDIGSLDLELVKGEISRRSLKEFIRQFWPIIEPTQPFVDGWIIDAYCEHLAHIREIKNLLVNVPPGTSKSLVFAVFFFCWQWLHNPSARFLYASYGLNLSERDSLKCRRLIAHPLYQKCYGKLFSISGDVDTKRHFENDKTGYRQAISVGSTTTGLKCNFAICDDALNATDSDSEVKKRDCITWFQDGFYNRLNDFGKDCRIVIGQRLTKDDLSAHILENYKETFTNLVIPYEYKPKTYVTSWGWSDPRTVENESCWPERFPESFINDEKKKQKKFSAQYNQEPIDLANALFKPDSFKYYEETADGYRLGLRTVKRDVDTWRIVCADLAVSLTTRADYTAIFVLDITRNGDIVIAHCLRDKMPGTKLVPTLCEINRAFHPAYILIEDVAFQRTIIDQAKAEGLPIRAIRPQSVGDKESRSIPLQVRFDVGQVWLPKDKPWLAALEKELMEFPNSTHDDMVDALSYGAIEAGRRRARSHEEEKPPEQSPERLYQEQLHAGLR